jgi:pyruvate carboxylase subunit B
MDSIGFYSLEAFGGATFQTYLELGEDPWDYLRRLQKATPNTPIQALVRGQNLVGQHNYADDAVELFVRHAARSGVDFFRFFDPLNDLRNMEVAIAAAKAAKKHVQGALCYAVSPAHSLDLWCSLAKGLADLGCDEVVIKDTSGLLSPQATWELVTGLIETAKLPVVVHSHCSSGMAPMAYMAAIEAGASVVDTAMSPLASGASQPATESVVAALAGGDYDTGLDLERLVEIKDDLERLKERHLHEVSALADRVDSDILRYQMPAAMIHEIHTELGKHGALDRMKDALAEVPRVRRELGYPPLVAPLRHMVAIQAVYNVIGGDRYDTVTQELKDYLQGLYGTPPQPADSELRRQVLGREEPITVRPADLLEPEVAAAKADLKKQGFATGDDALLSYLLFPALATRLFKGEVKPTRASSDGERAAQPEKKEEPAGEAPAPEPEPEPAAAAQTAEFEVEVEGEVFKVRVTGAGTIQVAGGGGGAAPAAAPKKPAQGAVVAPMQGLIVKLPVKVGDDVKLGDVVAVLEAMKMQNDIVSTSPGKVVEIYVKEGEVVKPNQPILAVA